MRTGIGRTRCQCWRGCGSRTWLCSNARSRTMGSVCRRAGCKNQRETAVIDGAERLREVNSWYHGADSLTESTERPPLHWRLVCRLACQACSVVLLPYLGIHKKPEPEGLQNPEDETLRPVQKAQADEIAIGEQANRSNEEWEFIVFLA